MPFFARPDLSNEQFRQLSSSQLTLSGQTQIANITGLTIFDGVDKFIPLVLTGGTDNKVMTFLGDKVVLKDFTGSGSGIYEGKSPTTCTVGGLSANTEISGRNISDILESILVPTINPTIVAPSSTFSITPSTVLYEVGQTITLTGCSSFSRGSITPVYCGGPEYRSGLPLCYYYNKFGPDIYCSSYLLSNSIKVNSYKINPGSNTISNRVYYSGGSQPLNSSGGNYLTPLSSGCTSSNKITISGIYPYFYGTYASNSAPAGGNRPTGSAGMISGGTKVVCSSTGTICINFNSTNDDYIWFATPSDSTIKTKWYVSQLNCGSIGGSVSVGGNLFPNPLTKTDVKTLLWSGQTYRLYISNYQTSITSIMELRNN